jgi:hypothetical protein
MIHVRINKKRKLFLYNDSQKITAGFDEIKKIGAHYLLRNIDKYGSTIESFIYNINTQQLSDRLDVTFLPTTNRVKVPFINARKDDQYQVYNMSDLSLVFETKRSEEDPYNFSYLGDDLYYSNKSILNGAGQIVSPVGPDNLVFKDGSIHIYSTSIENKYLVLYDEYFLIEDEQLNAEKIKNAYYNANTLFLAYEAQTSIYIDKKKVFQGSIEYENYNFWGDYLRVIISENKSYFILNKLFGPFEINKNDRECDLQLIFISNNYLVYLFQNNLLLLDTVNNKLEIKALPAGSEFRKVKNENLDPVFVHLKDFTIFELADSNKQGPFFYNPKTSEIMCLNIMKTVKPHISENTLFFLDADFREITNELKVANLKLVDYSYFQNNLYYIAYNKIDYVVKNINDITKELVLKEPAVLEGNSNILVKLSSGGGHKSDFYTLSDNGKKFVKPPFKIYGVYGRSWDYPLSRIDFSSNNESTTKMFEIHSDFPFYTTEE